MRAIHKGMVSFGLVNVPVKLYSATEDHDIKLHQIHAHDQGRIRYKRTCEECGEAVDNHDIVKAYEAGDQLVTITEDDIANLEGEGNREIEVLEFIPAKDLDPMMYERTYFLAPEKSSKSYTLLAQALMRSRRVAIVRFTMRTKTRLAALRVKNFGKRRVMILHTLMWPDEIREPAFPALDTPVEVTPAELEIAGQLIEAMTADYDPQRYRDDYQQQLRELIEAKLTGGEVAGAPAKRGDNTEDVTDILEKLKASVKAA